MLYKLFIPGPVEVSAKTYKAMTTPVVGHRSSEFVALYEAIQPQLQSLFYTKDPVFISTSSAWGVMEASLRNVCKKKVLTCMSGAFSDKWYDVAIRCGKDATPLRYEWGKAIQPDAIRRELSKGGYDAITLIHNETSTGTMNPIEAIMAVIREFPEVISIVDSVSSFSVLPILKDELGIDVLLTGSQKALALPPGMALFSVSERAIERSKRLEDRGYYFDFCEFLKNHEKGMTPSTPNIPLIYALRSKLEDIFEEGVENRYARHKRLNQKVHEWVLRNDFRLFPEAEYASVGLTCVKNTQEVDIMGLNLALKNRHHCIIDSGYGKIKGQTFRISNMGDETDETLEELLKHLDELLPEFLPIRIS